MHLRFSRTSCDNPSSPFFYCCFITLSKCSCCWSLLRSACHRNSSPISFKNHTGDRSISCLRALLLNIPLFKLRCSRDGHKQWFRMRCSITLLAAGTSRREVCVHCSRRKKFNTSTEAGSMPGSEQCWCSWQRKEAGPSFVSSFGSDIQYIRMCVSKTSNFSVQQHSHRWHSLSFYKNQVNVL